MQRSARARVGHYAVPRCHLVCHHGQDVFDTSTSLTFGLLVQETQRLARLARDPFQAATIIRVDFDNAVLSLCRHPCFDHADINPSQVGKLLSNLLSDSPVDAPILDGQQRQALVVAAQPKYGTEIMAPIL